jgi:hypothetical protein
VALGVALLTPLAPLLLLLLLRRLLLLLLGRVHIHWVPIIIVESVLPLVRLLVLLLLVLLLLLLALPPCLARRLLPFAFAG